jgi:hypothetical protein
LIDISRRVPAPITRIAIGHRFFRRKACKGG